MKPGISPSPPTRTAQTSRYRLFARISSWLCISSRGAANSASSFEHVQMRVYSHGRTTRPSSSDDVQTPAPSHPVVLDEPSPKQAKAPRILRRTAHTNSFEHVRMAPEGPLLRIIRVSSSPHVRTQGPSQHIAHTSSYQHVQVPLEDPSSGVIAVAESSEQIQTPSFPSHRIPLPSSSQNDQQRGFPHHTTRLTSSDHPPEPSPPVIDLSESTERVQMGPSPRIVRTASSESAQIPGLPCRTFPLRATSSEHIKVREPPRRIPRVSSSPHIQSPEPSRRVVRRTFKSQPYYRWTSQRKQPGAFNHSRNFSVSRPVIVDIKGTNNVVKVDSGEIAAFMEKFAHNHIIKGAELDSSDRDPPPRCHPGTRKDIVHRLQVWLNNPRRAKRLLWLVGAAGVGKSAIMQTVAELERERLSSTIIAALFFSAVNNRKDPLKIVKTLAYQIAVQHEPYRNYIHTKLTADPSLWERSIARQFTEFITEPFVEKQIYTGADPLLMFVDGLDECDGHREQTLFLDLVSDFTSLSPEPPILWIIASRPEAHITDILVHGRLASCYEKEEVVINSDAACRDVERFVRAELDKIRDSNPAVRSLYRQWPPEYHVLRLLSVAQGLFAFAQAAVLFVKHGDPISQLNSLLQVIDSHTMPLEPTLALNPMDYLDSLYRHIISKVDPNDFAHAEAILAYTIHYDASWNRNEGLIRTCNWIGITPNILYSALRELHSVLYIPLPHDAFDLNIEILHKSFSDFLCDHRRSGLMFRSKRSETVEYFRRAIRILQDVPWSYELNQRPPYLYIHLSWPCADQQEPLYLAASAAVGDLISTAFPDPSDYPGLLHALCVMYMRRGDLFLLPEIFDPARRISQALRQSGHLLEIPTSLFDLSQIMADSRTVIVFQGPSFHCLLPGRASVFKETLNSLIESRSPSSANVFLGCLLQGWAQFTIADPLNNDLEHLLCFRYDFSSMYSRLKDFQLRKANEDPRLDIEP